MDAAAEGVPAERDVNAGGSDVGDAHDTDRRGRDVAAGRRAAAAGVDAATVGGASCGGWASLAEVLGERTLHELSEWIHGFIPYQKLRVGRDSWRDGGLDFRDWKGAGGDRPEDGGP